MGGYPLAALSVQPPQDPTIGLERAQSYLAQRQQMAQRQQSLQQGQISLQQQQQQLKDQQAMTAAWKSWDGKSPDTLISGVLANGGSGNAANQLEQQMLARQGQHMALDKDAFDLQQKRTDRLLGRFTAAGSVSDDQLFSHVQQATQESLDAGDINQQGAQTVSQLIQQSQGNPQALRDGLSNFEKSHMLDSQIQARAKEAADTREKNANAAAKEQESQFYANNKGIGAPGVPAETVQMGSFLQQNPGATPASYPAAKAAQTSRAEAPVRIAVAQAEGQARAATEVNLKRQELSDTQYQQAIGADQRLARMEKSYTDASNGNQQAMLALLTDHIGMTLGLQKGARITKDIINEAAQSQPWLSGLAAKFDSNGYLSGVALSQTQMKQMLDMGYSQRENTWDAARNTSSMYRVAPPPGATAIYNQRSPNQRITPPAGAMMKVPGSDGHLHWSDGKKDLGRAD